MDWAFYIFLCFHFIILVVIVYNFSTAPKIKNEKGERDQSSKISVLIPARNEEQNIENCLSSVLSQSYKNIEVLVLNDQSDDNTAEIVSEAIKKDNRIRLINGKPLPRGWLGKNWACHQLAEVSSSELMLFIDADIQLSEFAFENAAAMFKKYKLQMLSCFPTQRINSFGEWLIVPLMNWLLLTFLPLKFVFTKSNKSFAAANGQFMMINKSSYLKIGGHKSVKSKVVEDMELVRRIKSSGLKAMTALGGDAVFCRMYNNFDEAVKGFTKNFYPGFNTNPFIFLFMITLFLIIFLSPFIISIFSSSFLWIIVLVLIQRLFVSFSSSQNFIYNILLHPLQMLMMFYVGIKSVNSINSKKVEWKGRKIN